MEKIPKGMLLTVSTGEYSDYCVRGLFRVIDEIDADALLEEWLRAHPNQRTSYGFEPGDFLAWVAKKGLLEPIDSFEWHLTDNGHASEMEVSR